MEIMKSCFSLEIMRTWWSPKITRTLKFVGHFDLVQYGEEIIGGLKVGLMMAVREKMVENVPKENKCLCA